MQHSLMEGAADGTGAAGGGAGDAGTGAPASGTPAGGAPAAGSGDAGKSAGGSLFSKAAAGGAPATGPAAVAAAKVVRDASIPTWVPEKFLTGEDFAKSYGELEGRMKGVGLPPKTAEEYAWEAPKDFPALDADKSAAFKTWALEHGMTQKQYQATMDYYAQNLPGIAADTLAFTEDKLEASLKQAWSDPHEYGKNMHQFFKAARAFATKDELARLDTVTDPAVLVRLLARIGAELNEDGGMAAGEILQSGGTLESLRAHPAYVKALVTGKHTPESQSITNQIAALLKQEENNNRMGRH